MTRNRWALVAVALATFMTYLDNNIVNVAIPDIQRELGLSTAGIEWVVSGYILTFAGLLLAGGRLADALRPAPAVPGRAGGLHGLLAARRARRRRRHPDRGPRPAGRRRRAGHADHAGDHQRDLHRPARAQRRGRHLGRRRRARPGGRPGARRPADPARLVGVDLLDQRADRHRHHGARRLGHHRVARGRGASPRPGRARPVDGRRCSRSPGP